MNTIKSIGRAILLMLILNSCKDEYTICDVSTNVAEKSGFYHVSSGVEQPINSSSFFLTQLGSSSPIYAAVNNLGRFSLPLNPLLDSAKYQISVNNNVTIDTITFVYTSQPLLINADCGTIYIQNLTRVWATKHKIDSVKISNNVINNTSGENLKIYF